MSGIFFANKIFSKFVQLPVKEKIIKKFEQLSFDLENGHAIIIALSARSVYIVRDVIILRTIRRYRGLFTKGRKPLSHVRPSQIWSQTNAKFATYLSMSQIVFTITVNDIIALKSS